MLTFIAIGMVMIVIGLMIVTFHQDREEIEAELDAEKRAAEKKEEKPYRTDLCSRIPADGTVEWARYVLDNYNTEFFKPVDIARATKILDKLNE